MSLAGRVVIVTGSGRGIGFGIAKTLASRGMNVAVNDIDSAAAASAANQLQREGFNALAFPSDITRKHEVEALVGDVERQLGPLWLLVNNAGVFHAAPTTDLSEEAWDQEIAVDIKGVFLCTQAALRCMMRRRNGRIVNIASIAGVVVRTGQIAYCSAKAAVVHFSRCLAVEVAPYGITVNCLCPGMTRTEMLEKSAVEHGVNFEAMIGRIPNGRMAEEMDHANVVAFLASQEAAHLTGQVICVDGGQSLNVPLT